ncbi:hypothetical protein ACIBQX_45130 [Nonomuraea sp. NPDC049714]|uniref:hypothetical protein n=1 Tax=Nonomuraea sp. NPDC049714 TaxID=3364357 RepID=UPI003796B761
MVERASVDRSTVPYGQCAARERFADPLPGPVGISSEHRADALTDTLADAVTDPLTDTVCDTVSDALTLAVAVSDADGDALTLADTVGDALTVSDALSDAVGDALTHTVSDTDPSVGHVPRPHPVAVAGEPVPAHPRVPAARLPPTRPPRAAGGCRTHSVRAAAGPR